MTVTSNKGAYPPVGVLLRSWRATRRMSQVALALECGVSARHLGFIELGKSRASRELVSRLADSLRMPPGERNALLLAAGYAPSYPATSLTDPVLERMREAVALILEHQNPYPAFVLNRNFDVLDMNASAVRLGQLIAQGRPPRHSNLLRQVFDPEDLRPAILNWRDVAAWFLRRLQDELAAAPGNQVARSLFDELMAYPDVPQQWRATGIDSDSNPVLTIDFRTPAGNLRFFETITTFAAPLSVTLEDLRIDSTFPADDLTAAVCKELACERMA